MPSRLLGRQRTSLSSDRRIGGAASRKPPSHSIPGSPKLERTAKASVTPGRTKEKPSRFSIGRLLQTPQKGWSSQKSRHDESVDNDSVSSDEIYLTSEESSESALSGEANTAKAPVPLEMIKTDASAENENDAPSVSSPCSPASSSSSVSTLPSMKEVIQADEEASPKKRNAPENDPLHYWKGILLNRLSHYGKHNMKTAEAYMSLGNAQLLCDEHRRAGKSFLSALKIYQYLYGDRHLSVARALDKLGLAACKTHDNLDLAIVALSDALKIRCEMLGANHVDSIDTLNNIAGVRLNMQSFDLAALDYLAVFRHRANVFGRNHASVAVTSYTLGCILQDRLNFTEEAADFFKMSLQVYESLGIEGSPDVPDIRRRIGIEDGQSFEFDGYLFVNSNKDELDAKLRRRLRRSCPVEI